MVDRFDRKVAVIGAGEVFRRCYTVGNKALPGDRRLCFSNIIDVIPEEEIRTSISSEVVGFDFKYWKLNSDYERSLEHLINYAGLKELPFLITSPTMFHVPYAGVVLDCGGFVGIEKPICSSLEDVERFKELIARHGKERIFLFAYYLFEKGLPLFVWARRGHVDRFLTELVTFDGSFPNWEESHDAVGPIKKIYGVILEGKGQAGTLDKRLWVLDPKNGGNTVETFYHLLCLVSATLGHDYNIPIADVKLGVFKDLVEKHNGRNIAETLTSARMCTESGVEIELIAAKYVPANWHQRWMLLICENGIIFMDFEEQRLYIKSSSQFLSSTLKWTPKYATQLMLLTEKLNRPGLPIEDDTLVSSLIRTLQIRQKGVEKKIELYKSDEVRFYITSALTEMIEDPSRRRANNYRVP